LTRFGCCYSLRDLGRSAIRSGLRCSERIYLTLRRFPRHCRFQRQRVRPVALLLQLRQQSCVCLHFAAHHRQVTLQFAQLPISRIYLVVARLYSAPGLGKLIA
jgi:hypothetical protein